ncbi:methionine--tRNA ligase [Streptosporangium saharense]|uniref:Methionine--tRNA ligase n=1 Tax=Streptosporangium saharense TaxID=1706840 RepID=A0A7W7VN75_9ACTN|nr:methionine--tRNA ligase [Streptosporangium saharense]MBB4916561.1 methionyl-tRNA synthetase [Streptosporangium saharense]
MSGATFISTTIPYVNAKPHLGHALEYVQADAYARHRARQGDDVLFMSGSDENSLKNVLSAERLNISTRELVDTNVVYFERLIEHLDLRVDHFVRTSVDIDHIKGATEFWRRMEKSGDIYSKEYEGLYCVGCEQFYGEAELVEGKCPEHLTVPELVRERNYFFRLSRYQDALLEVIESGALAVWPASRMNEVTSFIRGGLADISISRSIERARGWGIPVPGDPGQVMYVWIDALTNYVNGLGFVRDAEGYHKYWENADRRVHAVGKGVIRFHAVYWPAMLLSARVPLPTDVVVHGYITLSGQKLSKSLGNVVDPAELVQQVGTDAVRYYLLADISPFLDGDFSEERMVSRYNSDLANGLGNLVSRVTSMVTRYRDGIVPEGGAVTEADTALVNQVAASTAEATAAMDRFDGREALARIWDLVRHTNAYIDGRAPWHLAKADDAASQEVLDTTLLHLVGAVRRLGWLISPFLPSASDAILGSLGESLKSVSVAEPWLDGLPGCGIEKAPAIFPRLELPVD